jgi:hypothetical protein
MHRALTACVAAVFALVIGAGVALAEPSGPAAPTTTDTSGVPPKNRKACAIATALIPTATSVAGGSASNSDDQAGVLRRLADKESTPRKVKAALRKMADWFEAAPDRSVGERGLRLAALKSQVAIILTWGGKICGEPIVTTTTPTTTSLRFVPSLGP